MSVTRGTNLMQQLWFIIINKSTCFGHLYVHLQECRFACCCIWCSALGVVAVVLRVRCVVLCTVCEFVFLALGIQHSNRMDRILLSSVVFTALSYFSTISHKCHSFQNEILNMKFVFGFCAKFALNISNSKKNTARYYYKLI